MFDLRRHLDQIELNKNAQINQNDSVIKLSGSRASSGFRIVLPTIKDQFYIIKLRGQIEEGSHLFIYCESADTDQRLISREYQIGNLDKEMELVFQAQFSLTNFGLLFMNQNEKNIANIRLCQVVKYPEINQRLKIDEISENKNQSLEKLEKENKNEISKTKNQSLEKIENLENKKRKLEFKIKKKKENLEILENKNEKQENKDEKQEKKKEILQNFEKQNKNLEKENENLEILENLEKENEILENKNENLEKENENLEKENENLEILENKKEKLKNDKDREEELISLNFEDSDEFEIIEEVIEDPMFDIIDQEMEIVLPHDLVDPDINSEDDDQLDPEIGLQLLKNFEISQMLERLSKK